MPKPVANKFTSYEFTQAELFAATRFSDLQLMLIQTLIAKDAEQRVNMKITPNDLASLQEEAALKGSIEAMEYLLYLAAETPNPTAEESGQTADVDKSKGAVQ